MTLLLLHERNYTKAHIHTYSVIIICRTLSFSKICICEKNNTYILNESQPRYAILSWHCHWLYVANELMLKLNKECFVHPWVCTKSFKLVMDQVFKFGFWKWSWRMGSTFILPIYSTDVLTTKIWFLQAKCKKTQQKLIPNYLNPNRSRFRTQLFKPVTSLVHHWFR